MRVLIALMGLIVVGCASSSGVVPMGGDKFMISRSEKGYTTGSKVKADALKDANEFCAAKGKSLQIIKATSSDMAVFRSDPQAEVEFMCAAK